MNYWLYSSLHLQSRMKPLTESVLAYLYEQRNNRHTHKTSDGGAAPTVPHSCIAACHKNGGAVLAGRLEHLRRSKNGVSGAESVHCSAWMGKSPEQAVRARMQQVGY